MEENRDYPRSPAILASFATYREAEALVEKLAEEQFPVQYISIVADGLKYVEDEGHGRFSRLREIGSSFFAGAIVGGSIGFIFGLFDLVRPFVAGGFVALYGSIFGGIIAAVWQAVTDLLFGAKQNGLVRRRMDASFFNVTVHAQYLQEACRIARSKGVPACPSPVEPRDAIDRGAWSGWSKTARSGGYSEAETANRSSSIRSLYSAE